MYGALDRRTCTRSNRTFSAFRVEELKTRLTFKLLDSFELEVSVESNDVL